MFENNYIISNLIENKNVFCLDEIPLRYWTKVFFNSCEQKFTYFSYM